MEGAEIARTPYGGLVSEIMLQQTRVATVIPYWLAWMKRWPTTAALAAAPEEDIMGAWSGLGYYTRARSLHAAAKKVEAEGWGSWMNGESGFEGSVEDLEGHVLSLPGVGPYTASAVLSSYLGVAKGGADANVIRVVTRLLGLRVVKDDKKAFEACVRWVSRGMEGNKEQQFTEGNRKRAGESQGSPDDTFSGSLLEGLMELGATLCKTGTPLCGECPVRDNCQARKRVEKGTWEACCEICDEGRDTDHVHEETGSQEAPAPGLVSRTVLSFDDFPLTKKKLEKREEAFRVLAIVRDLEHATGDAVGDMHAVSSSKEVLVVRRANQGLLAGQRELPFVPVASPADLQPPEVPPSAKRKKTSKPKAPKAKAKAKAAPAKPQATLAAMWGKPKGDATASAVKEESSLKVEIKQEHIDLDDDEGDDLVKFEEDMKTDVKPEPPASMCPSDSLADPLEPLLAVYPQLKGVEIRRSVALIKHEFSHLTHHLELNIAVLPIGVDVPEAEWVPLYPPEEGDGKEGKKTSTRRNEVAWGNARISKCLEIVQSLIPN